MKIIRCKKAICAGVIFMLLLSACNDVPTPEVPTTPEELPTETSATETSTTIATTNTTPTEPSPETTTTRATGTVAPTDDTPTSTTARTPTTTPSELPVCNFTPMLVNARNPLPANYSPKLTLIGTYSGEERLLLSDTAPFATALMDKAKADGVNLTLRSTYRSVSRQETNFRNSFQGRVDRGMTREEAFDATAAWIAPPGTSEHNAGIAIDFNLAEERFENTREFTWLQENAHKFGFILRYPKDTTHLTGINYEPWHYTFVGINYAGKIRDSEHQTLECYLGATACRGDDTVVEAFRNQLIRR